ncbi:sortase-like protein [Bifidobacterium sp. DSM 109958]|uniref:Sortase-like protein n=1 Tax=Bifidobacterium moraviense TaxID=2675323 RepID=A0A7Y0HYC9_9BIFI|nr:sortase-like protein [Bifidobacterium sp. DSM 109958]
MKKLRGIAPLLVIALGLLVLFYPTISNFLVMKNASRVVGGYAAKVDALSDEQYRQMLDAAHAYNERLAQSNSGATDALAGAVDTASTDAEYNALLNLNGDGMMGYITVPRLRETMPIYHGTAEEVLQVGIGHLERTSLPVGGVSTHAALSGHRGLPTAKLFTDLNLMQAGDRFYITILRDTYAYEVDNIVTVLPTDTQELAIEPEQDLVTLITCTPYAVNTHRLLVRAHRIPYTPEQVEDAKPTFHVDIPLQYVLPAAGLIALLIGWRVWRRRDARRATEEAAERIVAELIGGGTGIGAGAGSGGDDHASDAEHAEAHTGRRDIAADLARVADMENIADDDAARTDAHAANAHNTTHGAHAHGTGTHNTDADIASDRNEEGPGHGSHA